MARNKYPGRCYRCGLPVAPYDGHFERYGSGWRTQHASCAVHHKEIKSGTDAMFRDIWEFDGWKIITTNGIVIDNKAVMGAGLALDAKLKYPELPALLARVLRETGNIPYAWPKYKIITFPTKHHFAENSSLDLIQQSAKLLAEKLEKYSVLDKVAMPRAGCLNGRLQWVIVKPVLDKHLAPYIEAGRVVYINP